MRERIQDLKSDYLGTSLFYFLHFPHEMGKVTVSPSKKWYIVSHPKNVLKRMISKFSSDAKPFDPMNQITLVLSGLALIRRNVKNCTKHMFICWRISEISLLVLTSLLITLIHIAILMYRGSIHLILLVNVVIMITGFGVRKLGLEFWTGYLITLRL